MSILREYTSSLKMAEVEEVLDLIFYRPIAFVFVKLIARAPVTPNQITLLSLVAGLFAAFFFSRGEASMFVWGAVSLAVANMLDCADGQLARVQGSGTPFGRLVDGVVDWVISIALLVCLAIGLVITTGSGNIWFLVVATGITAAIHSITFDFVQQEYLSILRDDRHYLLREIQKVEGELSQPGERTRGSLRRLGLKIYRRYLAIQRTTLYQGGSTQRIPPDVFRKLNHPVIRWWTLLGSTTNRSILILAALVGRPEYYCWIVVVAGNLYLTGMLLWRRRLRQKLDARLVQSPTK